MENPEPSTSTFPATLRLEEAERGPKTVRFLVKVEDAVERSPASSPMPVPVMTSAVMSDDPIEMFPKPEPSEPAARAPTDVKEEPTTALPRAVAVSAVAPLMRYEFPVAREMLELNVLVATSEPFAPKSVVVAVVPT